MVGVARKRSADHTNLLFHVGDFFSAELPAHHFDCIAAVAVLHHMPWVKAVERAAELLRVGGSLLIMDLVRDDGPFDLVLSGAAWALSVPGRLLRPQPRELRDAWAEHGRGDSYLTLPEVRRLCRDVLPGARVRRHLFWRYSVVWTKLT